MKSHVLIVAFVAIAIAVVVAVARFSEPRIGRVPPVSSGDEFRAVEPYSGNARKDVVPSVQIGGGTTSDFSGISLSDLPVSVERLDKIAKPDGPLAEQYDSLVMAANSGDSVAAYQLFLGLDYCSREATSEAELRARVDRIVGTKSHAGRQIADPRAVVAQYQSGFEYCRSVRKDVIAENFGWLALSAELGLLQGMVDVGVVPPPGDFDLGSSDPIELRRIKEVRDTAARWRHRAADMGSVEALEWLADAYAKGAIVNRDPTRAYAYLLAATTAKNAGNVTNKSHTLAYLKILRDELKPSEIHEATRIAKELLLNPRCCKL
ncbi:MAG: hypothetical protein WD081_01145 [Gammaproteobacteria bacterium]